MASEDHNKPTLELRRTFDGPIAAHSPLERSLLFAELSQVAFLHPAHVADYARGLGLGSISSSIVTAPRPTCSRVTPTG